jgi:hypothetical protein
LHGNTWAHLLHALKHYASLLTQFIGCKVNYQVINHYFSTPSGQIDRLDAEVDFLSVLSQVCGFQVDQVNVFMEVVRIRNGYTVSLVNQQEQPPPPL